jgi:hypothetical protein
MTTARMSTPVWHVSGDYCETCGLSVHLLLFDEHLYPSTQQK